MTLQVVFDKEKFNSILDVMPDVFSVWKVVLDNPVCGCFQSPYMNTVYGSGEQETSVTIKSPSSQSKSGYDLFYHFWVQKTFVLEQLNEWLENYSEMYKKLYVKISNIRNFLEYRYSSFGFDPFIALKQEFGEFLSEIRFGSPRVISCIVMKDWVTAMGKQHDGLAVVCRKAVFPVYPSNIVGPEISIVSMDCPVENEFASVSCIKACNVETMESNEKAMAMV